MNDTTAKYTMKVSDGEFDYSTTTTSPYSASKWSGMAGRGDGDNAPSSSSYVSKGIVDSSVTSTVAAHDGSDVDVTVAEGTVGTKMLMINNKQATAYGYRSSAAMRLFGGNDSYYKISVKVRTAALAEGGASIALTDGSNDSDPYLLVTDINTNGSICSSKPTNSAARTSISSCGWAEAAKTTPIPMSKASRSLTA